MVFFILRPAMKRILLLVVVTAFCNGLSAQSKHLDHDRYLGRYQIIYLSDSNAFINAVAEYASQRNRIPGIDSLGHVVITDTTFEFDMEYITFPVTYKYWTKKDIVHLNFYPKLNPQLSSVPAWPAKRYSISFTKVYDKVLGIHFKNLKTKEDNLLNKSDVMNNKAEPRYHEEYYGDLYLLLVKETGN